MNNNEIRKIIEKHSHKAIGEWAKNMDFIISVYSEVWDKAQDTLLNEMVEKIKKR